MLHRILEQVSETPSGPRATPTPSPTATSCTPTQSAGAAVLAVPWVGRPSLWLAQGRIPEVAATGVALLVILRLAPRSFDPAYDPWSSGRRVNPAEVLLGRSAGSPPTDVAPPGAACSPRRCTPPSWTGWPCRPPPPSAGPLTRGGPVVSRRGMTTQRPEDRPRGPPCPRPVGRRAGAPADPARRRRAACSSARPATGPSGRTWLAHEVALELAGGAAAVLLLVTMLTSRAARAGSGRRSKLAAAGTVADAVVVLGVIAMAGLPPRSFALVLLMLPYLEAALWFGLSGLAGLWTISSVALGAYVVVFPETASDDALASWSSRCRRCCWRPFPWPCSPSTWSRRSAARDGPRGGRRPRPPAGRPVGHHRGHLPARPRGRPRPARVSGAEQLGATDAVVTDLAEGRRLVGTVVSEAGKDPDDEDDGETSEVLTRELDVPERRALHLHRPRITGPADEVARRVEALELLVAQARVGLANAVLVQQLEHLKQTYQEQATRDQLTGLLNRRGLVLTAEQIPGHLGVLFCDLDGFKGVNDTIGHAAGDELLEKVARRLEGSMREDSVLGRMGGDEFVVVAPGASDEDLAGLGRRIEIDLGRPFLLEAGMARIGVSIGAAHAKPGERDLDSLLGQADHAHVRGEADHEVRPLLPEREPQPR